MHPLIKSKFRLSVLLATVLLAQCCCCIIPVGYQVQQENPIFRQTIERAESTLRTSLNTAGSFLADQISFINLGE